MAKKIKYYGVFAVKVSKESEFVKTMTEVFDLPKLPRKQIKVFIFDNELEQMKCLSNLPTKKDDIVIPIDSTSKDEFMKKVNELKEEYSKPEKEPGEEALFDVVLREVNDQEKLLTVKLVKETLGIGLEEAKDLVDGAPSKLAEKVNFKEADRIARAISSNCHCTIEVNEADEDDDCCEQEEPTNMCAPSSSN